MKRDTKPLILFAAVIGVAVIAAAAVWYVNHRAGLKPELVLTLPAAECGDLPYGQWLKLAHGPEVNRLCESKGVADGPFFALKGRRAETFQPDRFHSVYGTLQTTDGDPETVYVYRYHERYRPGIIEAP